MPPRAPWIFPAPCTPSSLTWCPWRPGSSSTPSSSASCCPGRRSPRASPSMDSQPRASSSHMPGRTTRALQVTWPSSSHSLFFPFPFCSILSEHLSPSVQVQRKCSVARCCSSRHPALPPLETGSPSPSPQHRRPSLSIATPSLTPSHGAGPCRVLQLCCGAIFLRSVAQARPPRLHLSRCWRPP